MFFKHLALLIELLENVADCGQEIKIKLGTNHKDVPPRRSSVEGDCLQTVQLIRRKVEARVTAR